MSWDLFKSNLLKKMEKGPNSHAEFAELLANEYDKAVKKIGSGELISKNRVLQANKEGLKIYIYNILNSQSKSPLHFDVINLIANGFPIYWTGATLSTEIIPAIPAPGAFINFSLVSNIVTVPGIITPIPLPIGKSQSSEQWINNFIKVANAHLKTVSGTMTTVSGYTPGPPPPGFVTAPGVIIWTGYTIPPSVAVALPEEVSYIMSEFEIEGAKEDLAVAEAELKRYEQNGQVEEAQTARETISFMKYRIANKENYSVPTTQSEEEKKIIIESLKDTSDIGKKIVAQAVLDIGTLEEPLPPGKPENWGKRVSQMLKNVGFTTPAFWCAAAVSSWYKQAGAKFPPSGGASCDVWMSWAKKNGLFSSTPTIGAAALFGDPSDAHHIGIVAAIEGSKVTTIEGNTSGGGFSRNGVGVFRKTPNTKRIVGYVLPVKN